MTTNDPAPTSRRWCRKVTVQPDAPGRHPDSVAGLDLWQMVLPGDHPAWSRYGIAACSLADIPGVAPATKHYPQATHEIVVFAIDPKLSAEDFDKGDMGKAMLRPMNYVEQVTSTDAKVNAAVETLARMFVEGQLFVEPQGIQGARELFRSHLRALCEDLAVHPGEAATPRPYLPIPVTVPASLSVSFEKDIVIVVAIDRRHDKTHIATFGREARDKDEAAALGDFLHGHLCAAGVSKPAASCATT